VHTAEVNFWGLCPDCQNVSNNSPTHTKEKS